MALPDTPLTRGEVYLDAIANGSSDVPVPLTREEQYLNAIANGDASGIPSAPLTRTEQYLDYIAQNGSGGGGGGGADIIDMTRPAALPSDYKEVKWLSLSGDGASVLADIPDGFPYIFAVDAEDESTDRETQVRSPMGYRGSSTNGTDWNIRFSANNEWGVYGRSGQYTGFLQKTDGNYGLDRIFVIHVQYGSATTGHFNVGKYYAANTLESSSPFIGKIGIAAAYRPAITSAAGGFANYLIPCVRKTDSVVGWYDVVNSVFKTSLSGTLVAGPDV